MSSLILDVFIKTRVTVSYRQRSGRTIREILRQDREGFRIGEYSCKSIVENYGRHYASLNDEELLSLKRDDLTATAQRIYDLEITRRGLDKILVLRRRSKKLKHLLASVISELKMEVPIQTGIMMEP